MGARDLGKGAVLETRVYTADDPRIAEHAAMVRTTYAEPVSVRTFKRVVRADNVSIPMVVMVVRRAGGPGLAEAQGVE